MQSAAPSFNVEAVRARLPGRRIDWFARTASTMTEARNPLEPGRIVVADEQTAGIGRHGHTWHSPAGEGLYVSIVLATQPLPVTMLALGLATREAVGSGFLSAVGYPHDSPRRAEARRQAESQAPQPDLRWPNDILLRGRKCAGVLAQLEPGAIIAGIGINVTQTRFPRDLDTPATSLLLEGAHVKREDLLVALVEAVDFHLQLSTDEIIRKFTRASSYAAGRRVRAHSEGRSVEGTTCGLDASGFLVVREDSGMETTILAGGVRACS